MVQTTSRAPPGSISRGRSTIAENAQRSRGCIGGPLDATSQRSLCVPVVTHLFNGSKAKYRQHSGVNAPPTPSIRSFSPRLKSAHETPPALPRVPAAHANHLDYAAERPLAPAVRLGH